MWGDLCGVGTRDDGARGDVGGWLVPLLAGSQYGREDARDDSPVLSPSPLYARARACSKPAIGMPPLAKATADECCVPKWAVLRRTCECLPGPRNPKGSSSLCACPSLSIFPPWSVFPPALCQPICRPPLQFPHPVPTSDRAWWAAAAMPLRSSSSLTSKKPPREHPRALLVVLLDSVPAPWTLPSPS